MTELQMEDELKFKYLDPNELLYQGLGTIRWVSKEDMLNYFPHKTENNNRESLGITCCSMTNVEIK